MKKPFASTNDVVEKSRTLEEIARGVWALTAEGDPNVGAIEGEDFVVCFEALATPVVAADWVKMLRERTDKPIRYLVLSHYHAVRVLGASAFGADVVVMHQETHRLVNERGMQDWKSEFERMPRLARGAETVPGLTYPTLTFADELRIDLGGDRGWLELMHMGRGHTSGDIVAWLPQDKILFAGDLVEAEAALYTGDAYHREWAEGTLDRVKALGAEQLVGGRGAVSQSRGAVDQAIEQSRSFILTMLHAVQGVKDAGGDLKAAFEAAHAALAPTYGDWPIFEHTLPFDVARVWDELRGVEHPVIWTAERDREVWDKLQAS